MFECVVNIAEGRDQDVLDHLSAAAGASLRDRHADPWHHRSVFTLIDEPPALATAVRELASAAYERIDLRRHHGVHPRIGVVDVVPFVALDPARASEACALRDEMAEWLATRFDVPVFLYGPVGDGERTLPDIRRDAFARRGPDVGPPQPRPERGASAVGCRGLLVAWNVWLGEVTLAEARAIAHAVRGPAVRSLAFPVGESVQVSCNLIDPLRVGPSTVYDAVAAALPRSGVIERSELVGLAPRALLEREPRERWDELDLSPERTIEARTGL